MTLSELIIEVGKDYLFEVEEYSLGVCTSYMRSASVTTLRSKHVVDISVDPFINSVEMCTPVFGSDEINTTSKLRFYTTPDDYLPSCNMFKSYKWGTYMGYYNKYVSNDTDITKIPKSKNKLRQLKRYVKNNDLIHVAKSLICSPIILSQQSYNHYSHMLAYKIVGFVKRDSYNPDKICDECYKTVEKGITSIAKIEKEIEDLETQLRKRNIELEKFKNITSKNLRVIHKHKDLDKETKEKWNLI